MEEGTPLFWGYGLSTTMDDARRAYAKTLMNPSGWSVGRQTSTWDVERSPRQKNDPGTA